LRTEFLPPAPVGALPTKLFDSEQTLHLNGATLALALSAGALTLIYVHFTDAIIHVADTFGTVISRSLITPLVAASTE
jgi:hypothetical protein